MAMTWLFEVGVKEDGARTLAEFGNAFLLSIFSVSSFFFQKSDMYAV